MDHGRGSRREVAKSNIARPISRLPLARASTIPTPIHQDEPSKPSHLPRVVTSRPRNTAVRPLGESNSASTKPAFGWTGRHDNGAASPIQAVPSYIDSKSLDTTPPNHKSNFTLLEDGNENITNAKDEAKDVVTKLEKRRPRPSLSERTIETMSQISPAPSPTRRRSSTIKSGESMGPPPRPASAMRTTQPQSPSTLASDRAPSPTKRPFRPPGVSVTPAKEKLTLASPDVIYTPPRAFMRDHASRIGRPARDNRQSASTAIGIAPDEKPRLKPANQAVRIKSMYDLRAAASRTLNSKPSLPTLGKDSTTPKSPAPRASACEQHPQTKSLRARYLGDNGISDGTILRKPAAKPPGSVGKVNKRASSPDQSHRHDLSGGGAIKSSAGLRDTIAKAKAARREQLQTSTPGESPMKETSAEQQAFGSRSVDHVGSQSLQKKLEAAVVSGSLNLSAMSLKEMPAAVLTMYDFREDSNIAWSETVDMRKLMMADNEIESLSEAAFPDWTEQELLADSQKSNQFGGLEVLDLHGNDLHTIPIGFRQLHRLSVLNLSGNKLNSMVFDTITELSNLRELRLAKNNLYGAVPKQIANMSNLQVLDLSDNGLSELPNETSELSNLQRLLVGGNRFHALSLKSIPSHELIELDISRNLLRETFAAEGLEGFRRLQSLDMSFNALHKIDAGVLELPSLLTLTVHNNRLVTLPELTMCTKLTTLTASNNALVSLPHGFYALSHLRNADLSGNSIKVIDSAIVNMVSLSVLNLTGNPLREKRYLTMNVEEIRTDAVRKADSANINDLVDTSEGVTYSGDHSENTLAAERPQKIRPIGGILDVSSRGLSVLEPSHVDLTSSVHTIRLANNNFTTFPVELLTHSSVKQSLRSLDMSHNPNLHSINYLNSKVHLPLLQSLYIVSTGLTTLETLTSHLKAPKLKELNISCHRLTGHLPSVRSWYPAVTTLLASDNWFESIETEAVSGLEVLDIRNNEIDMLPPTIGLLGKRASNSESGRLRVFECSGNKFRVPRLVVIEKGTEAVLKDLRRMVPAGDVPEEWANEV